MVWHGGFVEDEFYLKREKKYFFDTIDNLLLEISWS